MINTARILMLLCTITASAGVSVAGAKDTDADNAAYRQLTRELRQIHRQTKRHYAAAVAEARSSGGSATVATKAKVLAGRDQFDRKMTRLLLISLRHGWEVPDFEGIEEEGGLTREPKLAARLFSSVDQMIQQSFAAEARRIASMVPLPVISITAAAGGS